MQATGSGNPKAMWVAGGGSARSAEISLGARARGDGGVSEIVDYSAERGVGGAIFYMEVCRCDAIGRDGRADGGCVFDARKGMAEWRIQVHLVR